MSYQQTIIVGNLGQDPELKYMQSGTAVCNFSVAVTENWTDRQTNERKSNTTWYRVAAWGKQGENCNQYLRKGSQVMVIGNCSANAYLDKEGNAKASLDLRALSVQFLSKSGSNSEEPSPPQTQQPPTPPNVKDDIPF